MKIKSVKAVKDWLFGAVPQGDITMAVIHIISAVQRVGCSGSLFLVTTDFDFKNEESSS